MHQRERKTYWWIPVLNESQIPVATPSLDMEVTASVVEKNFVPQVTDVIRGTESKWIACEVTRKPRLWQAKEHWFCSADNEVGMENAIISWLVLCDWKMLLAPTFEIFQVFFVILRISFMLYLEGWSRKLSADVLKQLNLVMIWSKFHSVDRNKMLGNRE